MNEQNKPETYAQLLQKLVPGGFESMGAAVEMDCGDKTRASAMMIVAGLHCLARLEKTAGFALATAFDEEFCRLYNSGARQFMDNLVTGGFPEVLKKDANGKMPIDHAKTVLFADVAALLRTPPPSKNGN